MHIEPRDLAAAYTSMGETELLELAASYKSLTDDAQAALRAEFARRKLEPPTIEEPEDRTLDRKLVVLRRYRDLSEAIVARSLLESAGIYAFLCDENLIRLDWQMSNFIGGIRLQVEANDEQAAIDLLHQAIPTSIPFGGEADFLQQLDVPCAPFTQPSDRRSDCQGTRWTNRLSQAHQLRSWSTT
jgi:hypothetical protein